MRTSTKLLCWVLLSCSMAVAQAPLFVHGKRASAGCSASGSASDTFAGSASTPLATHSACWTTANATAGWVVTNLVLSGSNTVQLSSAFAQGGAIYSSSTSDISQAVYKAFSDYSHFKAACVRITPGTHSGYCFNEQSTTSGVVTKDGGFGTGMSFTLPSGSDHTIKISATGTSSVIISVTVDGGVPQNWTDASSPLPAGHPGIEMQGNGTISFSQLGTWQDH